MKQIAKYLFVIIFLAFAGCSNSGTGKCPRCGDYGRIICGEAYSGKEIKEECWNYCDYCECYWKPTKVR